MLSRELIIDQLIRQKIWINSYFILSADLQRRQWLCHWDISTSMTFGGKLTLSRVRGSTSPCPLLLTTSFVRHWIKEEDVEEKEEEKIQKVLDRLQQWHKV